MKSMTENPRPFWERGDHVSGGWGIDENEKKLDKLDNYKNSLIRPAATFSLREKAKNLTTSSHQKFKISKWNQCTENPRPTGRGGTTQVVGEGLANIIKSYKN